MKVSFYGFMAHDILEMSSWNIQLSESLVPWFHGPWNTLWQVFMENSGLMNLWSYEIRESLNKKLPFHGKFMARNKATKFNFAVFMGHEMPFMGYSLEIHGIFIKMWFIGKVPGHINKLPQLTYPYPCCLQFYPKWCFPNLLELEGGVLLNWDWSLHSS